MSTSGTDKNKPTRRASNTSKTPQSLNTSKNNSSSRAGKPVSNSASNNRLFINDINQLCMHCAKIVEKDDKGMQCNFCDLYIHNECDGKIPDELYEAINKYPENSLICLCPKCRPIIPPNKDQVLMGIVNRVEMMLDERPTRPKLSDQILETLADRVRDMDKMVGDHSRSMSELASDMNSIKMEFKQIAQGIGEMVKQGPPTQQNQSGHSPLPNPGARPHPALANTQRPPNQRQDYQNTPNQSIGMPLNQIPPRLFPQSSGFLDSSYDIAFPNLSQARSWRYPPPAPRPTTHQNQNEGNHDRHAQQTQSRGDINGVNNHTKPDPETTLVVYNTNRNENINLIVERLRLLCKIYSNETTMAQRLLGPPNKNPPITISCNSARIKWLFIKEINQLRNNEATANEFKSVFARPYLDQAGLRRDREMVRELNYLRSKNPGKVYKIYKNEIHEYIDGEYVKLNTQPSDPATRERANSVSSNNQYMTPKSSSRRNSIDTSSAIPSLESSKDQLEDIASALEQASSTDPNSTPVTPTTLAHQDSDTSNHSL